MTNNESKFWEEPEEEFNLKLVIGKYLRYWYWFVLSVALAVLGAFFYMRYATPIYSSSAVLLIKDEKKGGLGVWMH